MLILQVDKTTNAANWKKTFIKPTCYQNYVFVLSISQKQFFTEFSTNLAT